VGEESRPKATQHVAALMNDMNGKLSDLADVSRMQITAQAIEAIANHVAGIPGRKNLVLSPVASRFSFHLTVMKTRRSIGNRKTSCRNWSVWLVR
jgi:hypothetical protein